MFLLLPQTSVSAEYLIGGVGYSLLRFYLANIGVDIFCVSSHQRCKLMDACVGILKIHRSECVPEALLLRSVSISRSHSPSLLDSNPFLFHSLCI